MWKGSSGFLEILYDEEVGHINDGFEAQEVNS